jgi:hypothetical protein
MASGKRQKGELTGDGRHGCWHGKRGGGGSRQEKGEGGGGSLHEMASEKKEGGSAAPSTGLTIEKENLVNL